MIAWSAAVLLATALLAGMILNLLASDARTAAVTNNECSFNSYDLEDTLWLLHGSSGLSSEDSVSLIIRKDPSYSCSLLLLSTLAEDLSVNGSPATCFSYGSYSLVLLPDDETIHLTFLRDKSKTLTLRSDSLYFGKSALIHEKLGSLNKSAGIYEGFFLFSILFSVSLYMFKPSEKYLLFFAMHACIPHLFSSVSILSAWFPTASYWLSAAERSYIYRYLYILVNGSIHWLIYREFVNDRIGKYPYIVYLAASSALAAILVSLIPGENSILVISYLLYLAMYFFEGFILFRHRQIKVRSDFAMLLLAGWFFSLIFWTVRAANNLGFVEYPYSLGNYVAIGYTVSFLLCISGKFASKFTQADKLLVRTRSLNAELSELNDSLEQKVSERTSELQLAMEELERTQASKSALMTNIIHNLKTPLFSLKGYAELLKEEKERSNPEDADISYLEHICSNVDYLQDMIKQLLLFDRLEEKKITFHIVTVSLAGILGRLESAVYVSLRSKNICLNIINQTPIDFSICVDEFYLKQAIICILDNAIRHSPPNSRIDLSAALTDDNTLQLTITDHGQGMSPNVCAHIFDRGYSHRENGEKSSGLGLNIALEIVREHGGSISVSSTVGEGSSFVIELPPISAGRYDECRSANEELL